MMRVFACRQWGRSGRKRCSTLLFPLPANRIIQPMNPPRLNNPSAFRQYPHLSNTSLPATSHNVTSHLHSPQIRPTPCALCIATATGQAGTSAGTGRQMASRKLWAKHLSQKASLGSKRDGTSVPVYKRKRPATTRKNTCERIAANSPSIFSSWHHFYIYTMCKSLF